MRISDIFTMGGSGGRCDDSCESKCYSDSYECGAGRESLDDPRLRRSGIRAILGSRSHGGSGLAGLFELKD
ncbi:MAG: hypothetical protein QOH09_571 [Pseudonocardiales bacterium]|jgi:hypothetical protein|nr:hypothetical protein [Pseudonocardiales bacterium]MDT7714579.1 hypothetical protein [Pseudonocardiales bacterium]